MNTNDTATNSFYFIMFTSEAYKLQDDTIIDRKIITAGKLVVKAQYLCSIQVENNWYLNQHFQHPFITGPTHKILHPLHEVIAETDFHAIPQSACNKTQAKKPYQDILYV